MSTTLLMTIFGWLVIFYLLLLEPFLERRQMRRFSAEYSNAQTSARITMYKSAFSRTTLMGLIVILAVYFSPFTFSDIGFRAFSFSLFSKWPVVTQVASLAFLLWYIGYFFIFATCWVRIDQRAKPFIMRKMRPVEFVTPRTSGEYFWWIANACVAAFEELVYRGFLFFFLFFMFPNIPILAVIIISVSLEIIHYFPRLAAMKYVGTSGLAFTLSYLIFDSVIAAMIFHVLYDLRTLAVPFHWVRQEKLSFSE